MLKKITAGNSVAKITASSIISTNANSLISYTTEDAHNLFEGSRVTVYGLTGGSGYNPNVINGIVHRVPDAKTLIVKPATAFTATGSITVGSAGTLYAVNGQLGNTSLLYAQRFIVASPVNYNFVTPTLSVTASGSTATLSLGASGNANPTISNYTITRLFNGATSTTYTSASAITSTTDTPTGGNPGDTVTYTYKVTNSAGTNSTSASVALQYISQVTGVTATQTAGVANSINVQWTQPSANIAISSYTLLRKVDTGAFSSYVTGLTSTSYVDTSVSSTSTYLYEVQAVNGSVTSTVSSATTGVQPYYAVAPASVTVAPVAATPNVLTVSWSAVTENPAVTAYYIQRSTNGGSTWTDLSGTLNAYTSVLGSVTSTTESNLASSTSYTYRVASYNGQLQSAYTTSTAVQPYYIGSGVTTLNYVSTSSTALLVTANAYYSNPAVSSWKVERSSDGGSTWSTLSASASLPYTDSSGLVQNFTYFYRVTPTNAQLTATAPATSASITTYSVPYPVGSLSITTPSSTSVKFDWTAASVTNASTPVTSYTIKRADDSAFTTGVTTVYSSTNTAVLTYTDTTVSPNTSYYYRVYASNGIGDGNYNTNLVTTPKTTSTLALAVSSASIYYSQTYTFTATVSPAVAGRTVTVYDANGHINTTLTTNSSGQATVTYTPTSAEGADSWYASVATDSTYTAATASTVTTNVNPMPLTFTVSDTLTSGSYYNSGTSNTVTVTVKNALGATVSGIPVTFNYTTYGNSYSSSTVTSNSSGVAAKAYSSATQSYSIYLDNYTASSNYGSVSTGNYTYYIAQATGNIAASSTRSYDGAGALRYANSTTLMYHGYYDSTNGNQKSAMWFTSMPWTRIHDAVKVSSADLVLTRTGSGGNSTNTTFYIGTHGSANVQNTYSSIGGQNPRLDSTILDWSQTVTASLSASILTQLAGSAYGILIGPPASTSSTYYGILDNAASLNVTYYANPLI